MRNSKVTLPLNERQQQKNVTPSAQTAFKLTERFREASSILRDETQPPIQYLTLTYEKPTMRPPFNHVVSKPENNSNLIERKHQSSSNSTEIRNRKVESTYDYCVQLHEMCAQANANLELIRITISSSPITVKRKNKDGNLPLHIALQTDEPIPLLIAELLKSYPESAAIRNSGGFLPLFQACKNPKVHPSIIKMLLSYNPSAAYSKTYGSSALHMITHTGGGHSESMKHILHINPTLACQPNNFGNLPLHYLCAHTQSSSESIRLLLNHYPLGASITNKAGESPLSRAMTSWQAHPTDPILSAGLHILLRVLKPTMQLNAHEWVALRHLNWEARKHLIMCYTYYKQQQQQQQDTIKTVSYTTTRHNRFSLSDSQKSARSVTDIVNMEADMEDNAVTTITTNYTKVDKDTSVFMYCIDRITYPLIWELIISFI